MPNTIKRVDADLEGDLRSIEQLQVLSTTSFGHRSSPCRFASRATEARGVTQVASAPTVHVAVDLRDRRDTTIEARLADVTGSRTGSVAVWTAAFATDATRIMKFPKESEGKR